MRAAIRRPMPLALLAALLVSAPLAAQAPALTGRVTSAAEGAMEGVLVSLKRDGSTKTVTVVSHADGSYSFPRDRLEAGRYAVTTRAVKYVLENRDTTVEIAANRTAKLDLTLRDSNPLELALQLTDPEWFASYPLDDRTKWELFRDCSRCHTMRRPSMSTYDAEELAYVMQRMVYSAGSSPMRFQLPANATPTWGRADGGEPSPQQRRQAEAVAAVNLSKGMWTYELKTMPRPKGKETEVIYTTWDLPATARPHDTRIAADGTIFFNHFNDNAIGRLDPKTGEVREWRWPYRAREGSFQPTGARTLMGPDRAGRWYIGNQAQGGVVVFDPKTEQFEFHDPPGGGEMIDVSGAHVDGNAWRAVAGPVAGGGVYQIELATWQHKEIKGTTEKPLYAYDIAADSRNNVYGSARGAPYVWRIDAKTKEVTYYDIPPEPRGPGSFGSGMRRGITDSQDRLWFGEYYAGKLGAGSLRSQTTLAPPSLPR